MSATSAKWLISVDDHLIEPKNLWSDRLPAKYRDVGPRVERIDGVDFWRYEDKKLMTPGSVAVVGRPDWSIDSVNYDEMHPSCYDVHERVKAMNESGVLVETLYPSFPRFCGQAFAEAKDKELALLGVQAWNDFMIDEWCGSAPGRFIPLAMIPLWDVNLAVAEATRAIGKGARGVIFSENIAALGLPSIHNIDGYWNPLFQLLNDTGLPLCMHIGSSSKLPTTAPDAPSLVTFTLGVTNAISTLTDWIFSGNFFRFPNLKIVLSEGEVGWMPFVKYWLDRSARRHSNWAAETDYIFDIDQGVFARKDTNNTIVDPSKPPSELFKEHVYGCFIDDEVGVRNIDLIGIDNVMMETDFPHNDGSYPHSLKIATEQVAMLPAEDQEKLLRGNACRVFQFTPALQPSS